MNGSGISQRTLGIQRKQLNSPLYLRFLILFIMKKTLLSILVLLPVLLCSQWEIDLNEFGSGFRLPVDIQQHGTSDLYIVEKGGTIAVLQEDGATRDKQFLDITDRVRSSSNEQGLLGLAFHPDHATNGLFYVNYTRQDGSTVIAQFVRSEDDIEVGDPNSELVILVIGQPFANHNGGGIAFGPDGYLYIGTGDGGSGGDPNNAGQNPLDLLGKISTFGQDRNGEMYMAAYGRGLILKISTTATSTNTEIVTPVSINPILVQESLTINVDASAGEVDYHIADVNGLIIQSGKAAGQKSISTDQLIPGLYFLRWNKSSKSGMIKFTKI